MSFIPLVLSTRTINEQLINNLENSGCTFLQSDFILTEPIAFDVAEVNEYLLFTSQNAVRSVFKLGDKERLISRPAICVGIKTKELLEANGWNVVAWAHYAKELAPIIVENFKNNSITFFSGSIRRDLLPDVFRENNIMFNEHVVYQTILNPHLFGQKVDAICFYSPSAISSYLQMNAITDEVCFCIGDTTAEALKGITQNIVLAKQPTVESTLQACVEYYQ